jgi:DNA polymerase-3 subunit beta
MFRTDDLKSAIKTLYPVVPNKTTMPILQNILFQSRNGVLELTATNLEQSLTLTLEVGNVFNTCIPASTLNELLNAITAPEIDIVQDATSVRVNRNPGKTTIKTMEASDFPTSEIDIHNIVEIDAQTFAHNIKQCLVSTSEDKSHPIMTGILLRSKDHRLTIASADGFRMTYTEMMFPMPDFEAIIPGESAKVLLSVLKEGKAELAINESKIAVFGNGYKFTSQLLAGNFPDVGRLIPQIWGTVIEVDKSVLNKAVKIAMIFAKDMANIVTFNLNFDELRVTGESNERGNDDTTIKVKSIGTQQIEFAVNGYYLLEALTLMDDTVLMKLNSCTQPIGMLIPGDDIFVHLMMPMHLGRR